MKKNRAKLVLNKETLKVLNASRLAVVEGGVAAKLARIGDSDTLNATGCSSMTST